MVHGHKEGTNKAFWNILITKTCHAIGLHIYVKCLIVYVTTSYSLKDVCDIKKIVILKSMNKNKWLENFCFLAYILYLSFVTEQDW